ncbi:MAG: hypothetical protein HRU18_01195 [Pseudoalteromonas sp.]|uniref:hypothetical protein n=1 Tax=Pseudoalteromonas sp. TaxID=53249 RepID=UPI001DB13116|nr:hypothetical protein [Pseudoalteromonas sp.]NRA76795.1 hypothetical protein [Pseudoalteromonas sp.]
MGKRKRTRKGSALAQHYNTYKANAKRRGYDFRIREETFNKIVKSNCYYCGKPPRKYKSCGFVAYFNGIDRINNNEGYSAKNCVACCPVCNRMKGNLDYRVFMNQIAKIINNKVKGDYHETRRLG